MLIYGKVNCNAFEKLQLKKRFGAMSFRIRRYKKQKQKKINLQKPDVFV